ncbi:MAG: uridine kinase [Acidobacteriia bacterium]|nr:uridine kinase [Terriglobia bacterium]
MRRAGLLTFLADEIVARKREGRPLKVGIDGRCAAGKTMLADELGQVLKIRKGLEILRPSVDGFHHPRERRYRQGEYSSKGYFEDAFDYESIRRSLLEPLSGQVFPVMCREVTFDYRADLPVDAPPVIVGANCILLFEGLFLFRREINAYWDYRVLLDIDPDTALSRALVRDSVDPPDVTRRKYALRYEPAWQIYENEQDPEARADVVIDNREINSPLILKRA